MPAAIYHFLVLPLPISNKYFKPIKRVIRNSKFITWSWQFTQVGLFSTQFHLLALSRACRRRQNWNFWGNLPNGRHLERRPRHPECSFSLSTFCLCKNTSSKDSTQSTLVGMDKIEPLFRTKDINGMMWNLPGESPAWGGQSLMIPARGLFQGLPA